MKDSYLPSRVPAHEYVAPPTVRPPAQPRAPHRHAALGRVVLLPVMLLPLVMLAPLLGPGLPRTDDGWYHLFRAVELNAAVAEGIWYPRWAADFIQGLGYPIFNFYAPLANYLQLLVHATGLDFVASLKVSLIIAVVAGSLSMFLFARDLLGTNGALPAALTFVYAPVFYMYALSSCGHSGA